MSLELAGPLRAAAQNPPRQRLANFLRHIARQRAVVNVANQRFLVAVGAAGKLDQRARVGRDDHADAARGQREPQRRVVPGRRIVNPRDDRRQQENMLRESRAASSPPAR